MNKRIIVQEDRSDRPFGRDSSLSLRMTPIAGQVVVILLMVMVVVLTLGLSIASRATTDIKLATTSEESARAFAAAEAGIERALITAPGASIPDFTLGNLASVSVDLDSGGTGMTEFSFGQITADDPVQVWLTDYPDLVGSYDADKNGDAIEVYWGAGADCDGPRTAPAILITDVYNAGEQYLIQNTAVDPCGASGFESATACTTCTIDGTTLQYVKQLTVHSGQTKFLRVRLLFADGPVAVKALGNETIPSQGSIIESTGTVGSTQRRIRLLRSYPQVPAMFDHVIFSEGDISK